MSLVLETMTARLEAAVRAALDAHRDEIDSDHRLRAVRVEVRVKPSGEVRAVILQRESEWIGS